MSPAVAGRFTVAKVWDAADHWFIFHFAILQIWLAGFQDLGLMLTESTVPGLHRPKGNPAAAS
jgi:hypothetical protein